MENRVSEMIKLREQGLSFREIGERYGVSKQAVHGLIGEKSRKCTVEIEKIPYEGFYELFKTDKKMTFIKLAKIMCGKGNGRKLVIATSEKIRRLLCSESKDSCFLLSYIDNLLAYTGKTYEEMFKPRKH